MNAPSPQRHFVHAFTVIELLIVMSVIIVLAGLVLGTSGYVQKKGQRSRAEAEIAALSAALESYKADNGTYPRGQSIAEPPTGVPVYRLAESGTDDLDPRRHLDAESRIYQDATRYLYEQLSGDSNLDLAAESGSKSYFAFKPGMLALIRDSDGNVVGLSHLRDPFGNNYGYSTSYQVDPATGYNPTFDLWCTGGTGTRDIPPDVKQWMKNW